METLWTFSSNFPYLIQALQLKLGFYLLGLKERGSLLSSSNCRIRITSGNEGTHTPTVVDWLYCILYNSKLSQENQAFLMKHFRWQLRYQRGFLSAKRSLTIFGGLKFTFASCCTWFLPFCMLLTHIWWCWVLSLCEKEQKFLNPK